MTLVKIDLEKLTNQDHDELEKMHIAMTTVGFFKLMNFGSSNDVRAAFEAKTREFFHADESVKKSVELVYDPVKPFRGYFGSGVEKNAVTGAPNVKETLAWGPMGRKRTLYHGPNKVPAIADFESSVNEYCTDMARIGLALIDAFEVAFQLDGLRQKFAADPSWLLMCVSYPPTPAGGVGVGEHTDIGFLTILHQDQVGGLEVQTTDGTWLEVEPEADTLVVNIGDMMANFSNQRVKATVHRVFNAANCERFSWPFFFDPTWEAPIYNDSAKTYGEYATESLNSYYL